MSPLHFTREGGNILTPNQLMSRDWKSFLPYEKLFSSLLLHYSIQIKRSILWDMSV